MKIQLSEKAIAAASATATEYQTNLARAGYSASEQARFLDAVFEAWDAKAMADVEAGYSPLSTLNALAKRSPELQSELVAIRKIGPAKAATL